MIRWLIVSGLFFAVLFCFFNADFSKAPQAVADLKVHQLAPNPGTFHLSGFGAQALPAPRPAVQDDLLPQCQTTLKSVAEFEGNSREINTALMHTVAYLTQHPECHRGIGSLPLTDCPTELIERVINRPQDFRQPPGELAENWMNLNGALQRCLNRLEEFKTTEQVAQLKDRPLQSVRNEQELAALFESTLLGNQNDLSGLQKITDQWVASHPESEVGARQQAMVAYASLISTRGETREEKERLFRDLTDRYAAQGYPVGALGKPAELTYQRLRAPENGWRDVASTTENLQPEERLYYHAWDLANQGRNEEAIDALQLIPRGYYDNYPLLAMQAMQKLKQGGTAAESFVEHPVNFGNTIFATIGDGSTVIIGASRSVGPLSYGTPGTESLFEKLREYQQARRFEPFDVQQAQSLELLRNAGLPTNHDP